MGTGAGAGYAGSDKTHGSPNYEQNNSSIVMQRTYSERLLRTRMYFIHELNTRPVFTVAAAYTKERFGLEIDKTQHKKYQDLLEIFDINVDIRIAN